MGNEGWHIELLNLYYKRYTDTVSAKDYVDWALDNLDLPVREVKMLASMDKRGNLNIFEAEKMFDDALLSADIDMPTKNQCVEHRLKGLHAQLLLPNDEAIAILDEIYQLTIEHELFREQMDWQEVSDAADDFRHGDNFFGYTEDKIKAMILANARKLWHCETSGITFQEFIGQKIVAVDSEFAFILQFEKGALAAECPWRIRDTKEILIGETDINSDRSKWRKVEELLEGKTVQDVQLYENCPFLIIQCDGIFLDLFHASAVFDGWTLTDEDDAYFFAVHGGGIG